VPKVVDHEERRAELAAAVWRLVSSEGLDALTVRRVAAEAGWSTGALVHYFPDKEALVLFAFRTVADRVGRRVDRAAEQSSDALAVARSLLLEGLPIDSGRRAEVRVWFAFLGLALTRPSLAKAQRVAYRGWRSRLAQLLRSAQRNGRIYPDVDAEREAAELVALVDGLAVQATFEPRAFTSAKLVALVDARLDSLVVASEP
jgi:AcrR family transcriptional regulator